MAAWAATLLFLCPAAWAQQPAADTSAQAEAQADIAEDRTIVDALPATERLAIGARRLLVDAGASPTPVWLNVQQKQTLGFWQEDMSGAPVGAVLMLHAEGHSPRWPATLLNMHHTLPRFGWATLSVELPPPAGRRIPPRPQANTTDMSTLATSATEGQDQEANTQEAVSAGEETQVTVDVAPESPPPDSAATAEDPEQVALLAIQAAIDYLHQQGQQNIVLFGEGFGARRALKYLASKGTATTPADVPPPKEVRALVMLDARLPSADERLALIAQPQTPTLDLITSANFDDRAIASERRQAAKKVRYQTYLLRRILPPTGAQDRENDITRAVRGFITRYAQGEEVAAPQT